MMKKCIGLVAGLLLVASGASAVVVEDFECATWPCATWVSRAFGSTGAVTAAAVHDGLKGYADPSGAWWCKTGSLVGAGDAISMWTRHVGTPGRTYFTFAGSAAGGRSFVSAPNTGDIRFQDNTGFGFIEGTFTPFAHTASTWYHMELSIGVPTPSSATGVLASSTGTVLATVVHTYGSVIPLGEICIRGFSGQQMDTIESGPPVPRGACCTSCLLPGFNCQGSQTQEACELKGACYLGDDTTCITTALGATTTSSAAYTTPPILATTSATTMLSITAPGQVVVDVNAGFDVTTTFVGDIELGVKGPAATAPKTLVSDNQCGAGDNIDVTFDDEAVLAFGCTATPALSGTRKPQNSLTAQDLLSANGMWTLDLVDTVPFTTQTLTGTQLVVEHAVATVTDNCSSGAGLITCPACSGGPSSAGSPASGPGTGFKREVGGGVRARN